MNNESKLDTKWLYDSPVHSDLKTKLRRFLVENADRILGIQVCAYKDGEVIIDTAAGVLGKDDPRPVQNDSLFVVFSVTKGITSGMVHWLVDKGKLKLDENVANIWPEFGTNGKDQIKVNHILNHTAGLHNALGDTYENDHHTLLCNWDECLKRIAMFAPETEPGCEMVYHYLSYGWLCGGIIEHASGKKFQDVLKEAFVLPLNVEGEFYIGIPPGVESRLATVALDANEHSKFADMLENAPMIPSAFSINMLSSLAASSNILNVRRAIVPAVNGHFSARALARYYAALVAGGVVPPLGSHTHNPTSPSQKIDQVNTNLFTTPKAKIHDAFLGSGDYKDLISPNGMFGLGFQKVNATDGSVIGFGHAGFGGSTGYCDINNGFAIAVTLNKLTTGSMTADIIRFVCLELGLPVPEDYAGLKEFIEKPEIN